MAKTGFTFTNKAAVVAALEASPEIFADEFQVSLRIIAAKMVATTVEETPVGTGEGGGNLYQTIHDEPPAPTPTGWIVMWGTNAEHAEAVEMGRAPGSRMPPVEAIARWVWLKRYQFAGVDTPEDAARVGFVIARSIGKKGFARPHQDGWRMFEKALHANKGFVADVAAATKERITDRVNARWKQT